MPAGDGMKRAELESKKGMSGIRIERQRFRLAVWPCVVVALAGMLPALAQNPSPASSPASLTETPTTTGTPSPASSAAPTDTPLPAASPSPATASPSAAAETASAAAQFPGYRFSPAQKMTYRVEYTSVSNADLRALFQDQNGGQNGRPMQSSPVSYYLTAGLEGEMTLTTASVTAGRARVFAAFREPHIRLVVNGALQTEQASALARDLSRGFLLELTPQGQVAGLYLHSDAAKFTQDFVRTLLAAVQFVFPAAPPSDGQSWTIREEDRNGAYLARYRIVSASVAGHPNWIELRKNKLRYLPEVPADTPPVPGRMETQKKLVPKMNIAARFDLESGALVSLAGNETEDTSIQDKMVAHSETMVHLSRLNSEIASADEMDRVRQLSAALAANAPSLTLYARRSSADVEANVQRSELGSATVKELLDSLAALKTASLGREQQLQAETPLYLKIKALIYLHPESCPQLEPVLESTDASSAAFRIIARALGAVGHAAAQKSLVHAIRARAADTAALPNLISTLGAVPQPTAETVKALQEVAAGSPDSNISGTAFLALGSMAKNLNAKEPQRSAGIVSFLLDRASAAQSEQEKQHALESLGNTGSSRALPVLLQFTSNPSPALRAAAVDALRSIHRPEVDPVLLKVLSADENPHVRLEAAFALSFREPDRKSHDAQKKALSVEGDEKVRAALLGNLSKMSRQFPDVRSLVENAAANDPSEYVRKAATGFLQQMSGSSSH